jgi:hypothetical protein
LGPSYKVHRCHFRTNQSRKTTLNKFSDISRYGQDYKAKSNDVLRTINTAIDLEEILVREFLENLKYQTYRKPEKISEIQPPKILLHPDYFLICFADGRVSALKKANIKPQNPEFPSDLFTNGKVNAVGILKFKEYFDLFIKYFELITLFTSNSGSSSLNRKTLTFYADKLGIKLERFGTDVEEINKLLRFWYTMRLNLIFLQRKYKKIFDLIFEQFIPVNKTKDTQNFYKKPSKYKYLIYDDSLFDAMFEAIDEEIIRISAKFETDVNKDQLFRFFENNPNLIFKFDPNDEDVQDLFLPIDPTPTPTKPS